MNIKRLTEYADWLRKASKEDIWLEYQGMNFEAQMPIKGLVSCFPYDWEFPEPEDSDYKDDDKTPPELVSSYEKELENFNEDWSIYLNDGLCCFFGISCAEGRYLFVAHDGYDIGEDDPNYPVSPDWDGNQIADHIMKFIEDGGLLPEVGSKLNYTGNGLRSNSFFKDSSEELEFIGFCFEEDKNVYRRKALVKGNDGILVVSCYRLCQDFKKVKIIGLGKILR